MYEFIFFSKFVKTKASTLHIDVKLFEEMLRNYKKSMERKKVELEFFEKYYEIKQKPTTPQRIWLRNKIPKKILGEILKVLSTNKIAKILGVNRYTIKIFAEECGFYFLDAGYYIRINQLIRYQGRKSDFYKPFHRWIDHLKKIGKFNDR